MSFDRRYFFEVVHVFIRTRPRVSTAAYLMRVIYANVQYVELTLGTENDLCHVSELPDISENKQNSLRHSEVCYITAYAATL